MAEEPELVSHLKYSETLNLHLQLQGKVEAEWHRILYAHAALVAVMVFFANQQYDFVTARVIVYVFYSMNAAFSWLNMRDAYRGLRAVQTDIALFAAPARGGASIGWVNRQDYRANAAFRSGLMVIVWLVVSYLLLGPVVLGRAPGAVQPAPGIVAPVPQEVPSVPPGTTPAIGGSNLDASD